MSSWRLLNHPGPRIGSALLCLLFAGLSACAGDSGGRQGPRAVAQPVEPLQAADGAAIYAKACATCHDGGSVQAPRREALAILPANRILAALSTGIMQAQAAGLSDTQRNALAIYLSQEQAASGELKGVCPPGDAGRLSPVLVSDWGMSEENARAVDGANVLNALSTPKLKLDWVFAFPNGTRARSQPTLAGDTLFTADQTGAIYALNAHSGCIRWRVQTAQEIRSALVVGRDKAGVASKLYFGDIAGNVHALDIPSRKLLWSTRPDDHAQASITGSLRLFEGRLYVPISSLEVVSAMNGKYACCTFRGAVAAMDAATGKLIWKTYTIAEAPTTRGVNREGAAQFGPSGAPVWSSPTIDSLRRQLYVGSGENYSHPATDKSDSIIALDMATGKITWHFQALAEDVWNAACAEGANCPVRTGPDYDFGAPPLLTTLKDGRSLVLAGQKSGYVYALDPDKGGALVWKAKPGRGGIMGGVHWGMTADLSVLYAPVSDLSVYPQDAHLPPKSGMHAIDVATGRLIWSTILSDACPPKPTWRCSPGVSAAATRANDVVFAASLDGLVRGFSTKTGEVLWSFDTNRDFTSVNGVKAFGGTIDSAGPVVAGNRLYVASGYDKFGEKAGNVLLAFKSEK